MLCGGRYAPGGGIPALDWPCHRACKQMVHLTLPACHSSAINLAEARRAFGMRPTCRWPVRHARRRLGALWHAIRRPPGHPRHASRWIVHARRPHSHGGHAKRCSHLQDNSESEGSLQSVMP